MLKAICEIESITQFVFNKHLKTSRESNESWDDYEERVWKERAEFNGDGTAYLNPLRFKQSIISGAQWKNRKIEGEGNATYTKHFKGGVVVLNSLDLNVSREEIERLELFTRPKKNQGGRMIYFPVVPEWSGFLEINILDEKVTPDIFREFFGYAGIAIGIGAMRPENGGENGRYDVVDIVFEKK